MLERDSNPTIDYVLFWLEHAGKAIQKKPGRQSEVNHWTHANYSGGRTGWEEPMSQVYFKPSTLEERLLQAQVHKVMLIALDWALKNAEQETPYAPWTVWDGLDLAEAYRIAHMVVQVEPILASGLKIRLNKICARMGKDLPGLVNIGFMAFMQPRGLEW